MITRRSLIKSAVALPFLGIKTDKAEKQKCEESSILASVLKDSEISNRLYRTIYQYWRGRWYKANGNRVEWTDYVDGALVRPLCPVTDSHFVHWNIMDVIDYCEALVKIPDNRLIWLGKREVWEIDYDYCYDLKEFMHSFKYLGERKYVKILKEDQVCHAGISL